MKCAFDERHPVRRVGDAEGAPESGTPCRDNSILSASSFSRHFQGAFLHDGYPGSKPGRNPGLRYHPLSGEFSPERGGMLPLSSRLSRLRDPGYHPVAPSVHKRRHFRRQSTARPRAVPPTFMQREGPPSALRPLLARDQPGSLDLGD
jgi:hypothetical protein